MKGDGIPWNVSADSAAEVGKAQLDLWNTQPDDQIAEGREWDDRARNGIVSEPDRPS